MAHYSAIVKEDRTLELPEEARSLFQPGQIVEIDLLDDSNSPDEFSGDAMLATLHEIARRQAGRRHTDGSQTDAIIREGRNGDMYGYAPS